MDSTSRTPTDAADASVNEDMDVLQPTEAALGEFAEDVDVDEILQRLTAAGLAADTMHAFVGKDGLDAYKDRASSFARLFDDTDERMVDALFAGRAVVFVFDIPEDRGDATRDLLKDAGALETIYFGKYTHEG